MSKLALLSLCALVSSCVTMTDPTPMGEGRYMVTLNAHGGFQSDGELLTESVNKANEFCRAQGLGTADIVSTDHGGTQMWTPQHNQVVFRCEAATSSSAR